MGRGQSIQYKRLNDEVARLALAHKTASAILHELAADAERLGVNPDELPDESTIRKWLKVIRTSDKSGAWVPLAEADPRQALRVFPVLAEVVKTQGETEWLTRDKAALVDRVVIAAPGVPGLWAWALAYAYQWARANESNTQALDLTLAIRPWESVKNATIWAGLLSKMGDRAGGWPGGGPGILSLAARLPPPDWARGEHYWGAVLWRMFTEEMDSLSEEALDYIITACNEPVDSKVTAEPLDAHARTRTEPSENPH